MSIFVRLEPIDDPRLCLLIELLSLASRAFLFTFYSGLLRFASIRIDIVSPLLRPFRAALSRSLHPPNVSLLAFPTSLGRFPPECFNFPRPREFTLTCLATFSFNLSASNKNSWTSGLAAAFDLVEMGLPFPPPNRFSPAPALIDYFFSFLLLGV